MTVPCFATLGRSSLALVTIATVASMTLASTATLADQSCAITFHRGLTLGTEVWRQYLPDVDKRWPALELFVAPTEPYPGVVTGWDVELMGLGEADLFYPKSPGFYGPGPLAIGPWLLNRPLRPLVLLDKRFRARVDVKELVGLPYVLKPGDPEWLRDTIEMKRAQIIIDLEWYISGRPTREGRCAAAGEPSP